MGRKKKSNIIRLDEDGNPYFMMEDKFRDSFPQELEIQAGRKKYIYYIEPRIYLPSDGAPDPKTGVVMNSVAMVRYITSYFMADNLDRLIDGEK